MEVTNEVAEVRNGKDDVAEVRNSEDDVAEDAADVKDTALAVEDAHGSVRPLIQDVDPGADGGVPMEWAQDVQDPFLILEGLVGLGEVNSCQTQEVSVPPA